MVVAGRAGEGGVRAGPASINVCHYSLPMRVHLGPIAPVGSQVVLGSWVYPSPGFTWVPDVFGPGYCRVPDTTLDVVEFAAEGAAIDPVHVSA